MDHPNFHTVLQEAWGQGENDQTIEIIWLKLKIPKRKLRSLNSYMASYQQKLILTREKLDIVQLQGHLLSQDLFEEEKQLIVEIAKWSSIEEQ
ncbi:hypothetical protein HAX54_004971, partial [Datura stramonium]|nr:hypothetical protein [Datura stramonium]